MDGGVDVESVPMDGICLVVMGSVFLVLAAKLAKDKAGGKKKEQHYKEYFADYVERMNRYKN